MNDSNKMLKTAGFMTFATLFAKVCGLARDMLLGAFFGTGIEATAFQTASTLPTLLFDLVIGGVISATFIPVFNSVLERTSKKEALEFANKFITMILLITVGITVLGITFSDSLVKLITPGLNVETHNLARELSNIMFPMIIMTGLAFSFVGILQSFGEFNIPSIISLISNVSIILYFVIFGKHFGIYGLAVTMLIAWSLQVLVQIPALHRFKFKYKPSFRLNDPNIKHALTLALPMLVSTWVQPLYFIVNKRLASGLNEGRAIVALDFSNRLYIIVVGVFSFVVTNLIFPKLSRANVSNNKEEARSLIATSLKSICMIILPLMAGFIILAHPIISIIYGHGKFSESDVSLTATALTCFSFGMIGMAFNEILSKTFFSMQDSKTPMITALASMVLNIILAYTLSIYMGIGGLALASAGGSTLNAILNYILLKKRFGNIFKKEDFTSLIKIVLSAIIMTVVVALSFNLLQLKLDSGFTGSLMISIGCAVIGVVTYGIAVYILKVPEIQALKTMFQRNKS